jgi:hypothetical protein
VPANGYWIDQLSYEYAGIVNKCTRDTCFSQVSNSSCWDVHRFTNSTTPRGDNCNSDELQCSEGAGGPLCGSCRDGYVFQSVSKTCEQCGAVQAVAYISLGVVIFVCMLILVYLKMGDHFGIVEWQPVQYLLNFERGSLKVLWVTYQIVSASSYTIGIEVLLLITIYDVLNPLVLSFLH